MTSHIIRPRLACTLLTFVFGIHLYAQAGVANGSIRGTVQDSTGAAVAKASAGARNLDTGFARSAMADETGSFELPLLPVGRYEVTVKAPGFAPYQRTGVIVELARASDLAVRLAVAKEQQSVTVEGDASILTTSTSSVTGSLNQKSMENMPGDFAKQFQSGVARPRTQRNAG